jgi:hypothetical protein
MHMLNPPPYDYGGGDGWLSGMMGQLSQPGAELWRPYRLALHAPLGLSLDDSSCLHRAEAARVQPRITSPTSTLAVIKIIGVGLSPVGVAVNDQGDTVYVTNLGSDDMSVINGRTGLRRSTPRS